MPFALLAASSALAKPKADLATYEKEVLPLLEAYCMDCHDADTKKGRFDLENLVPDILTDDDVLERWRLVEEQLHFGDMPPEKKKQPDVAERARILHWIRSELFKTQLPDHLGSAKLHLPQFGNYVDHAALFGKRLSHVTPAPPRLWRLRPAIYNSVMRGGSWVSIPQYCRSAHRQKMGDRDQRNYLGVRVVIRKASTATPKKK